jgi:hypothetical protein
MTAATEMWANKCAEQAAEIERLRDALMCARRHLVTLGGEARLATDDDQIQAQVLFVVDTAVVNSVKGTEP